MLRRTVVFLCFFAFISPSAVEAYPLRSFSDIFYGIGEDQKREVFSPGGLIRSVRVNEALQFIPAPGSEIDIHGAIMQIGPTYLAESLLVIPFQGRTLSRLDAYNALGNVRDLQGRLYHSHTRNAEIPLFEEATRIEGDRRHNPIPDPPPASVLPLSETMFIRLRDVNFGNSYYRGDMTASPHGIFYSLTNTRNLSYILFPVLREGKFNAILYMEPLAEGMLIYSMAGADASDFIANRVDIPSAISKRLAVFIAWISDGLIAAK
jgi:hypothetical protein